MKIRDREISENIAMTIEESLQIKIKYQKTSEIIKAKDFLIKESNEKITELETLLKLQKEGLVQKKDISMESALFYFVTENPLSKLNNHNKSKAREGKQNNLEDDDENLDDLHELAEKLKEKGDVNLDSVNMKQYQYLRPNYRAFLGDLLPNDEHAIVEYSPPFPMWLQVTIRAIFDAKYNEYLLSFNKGKKLSRFPEFVYSWLGMFCIDKETNSVRLMEYTEKDTLAAKNRVNLLLGLESASATKIWKYIFSKISLMKL